MIVGYVLQNVLGLALALTLVVFSHPAVHPPLRLHGILAAMFRIFCDCAIFFALSIQIASMVVLVRRDFGICANGLGGLTTRIVWSVALVTLVPTMYPVFMPWLLEHGGHRDNAKRNGLRFVIWLV